MISTSSPRVAFVVQRCGREVNGGAEAHCLQMAQRMSRHWRTEVLTTCALDYMTWANHYPAGEEVIEGVMVRRFAVDAPRDIKTFNALSEQLSSRQRSCSLKEQEAWMRAQGPMSQDLAAYVTAHRDDYDAFIFFTYLYATTYFLLPLVKEKAWLAPLAHDEWPIYFPMWERLFAMPRGLIFNSEEEHAFLQKRFHNALPPGPVVGVGFEPPSATHPVAFREKHKLTEPFLLYVGRVDVAKGCDELLDYFRRLRQANPMPRKLVLVGRETMSLPQREDIFHLGFVDEQTKWDAMSACDWLVVPSFYESLSMVLLEAWSVGRPAIVNGRCPVLVGHCRKANAGLWYSSFEEFQSIVSVVEDSAKNAMGRLGAAYVRSHYNWEGVEQKYLALLQTMPPGQNAKPGSQERTAPNLSGMGLAELQANWDKLGKTDPFWSIITAPSKRGRRWNADEFFATGHREIAGVMAYVQSLGVALRKGRALDFGCGVGRLTQALCGHFSACDGVDIAPSMIELAQRYNKFGKKCCYHLNEASNLSLFADNSFDFIYSCVTLQHMRPDYSVAYLKEFLRVLAPGGLAVFQLPGEPVEPETLSKLTLDATVESQRKMFELVGSDEADRLIAGATTLPEAACKAQIRVDEMPATLAAGDPFLVTARVKNLGDSAWLTRWLPDGRYEIRLGNHWMDRQGNMVQNDDGRAPLPHDLQPGEEVEMSMVIRAPAVAGAYILELDMVQEGVVWFKSHGSATVIASIEIRENCVDGQTTPTSQDPPLCRGKQMVTHLPGRGASPQDAVAVASSPVMELHGIPMEQVIALLQAAGGRLVDVQRYDVCGPSWKSYRYVLTK